MAGLTQPRLLVVTSVPGTISHFLLPYLDYFRALGWTVDTASADQHFTRIVEPRCDNWHEIPFSRRAATIADPRVLLRCRRVILDGDYDIVHVHTPIAAFLVRCAVGTIPRRRRPKIVYTAHGFHFMPGRPQKTDRFYRTAERIAGRWTDRLVVINETDRQSAVKLGLVPAEAVVLMPGIGIDLDHYRMTPELAHEACELRSRLGIAHDAHVVSMIAEFAPGKNHSVIVEAFARLDRTDIHLVSAGGGRPDVREATLARCSSLGIAERFHVLGEIEDVRPAIAAADLTTLPSRREGLSRAVLESLAMGVPVLGANTRGITDSVLPDGGLIVDPDDVDGVAAAIAQLVDHRDDHFDVDGVASRIRRYGLPHTISMHTDLYSDLLQSEAGGNQEHEHATKRH